MNTRSSISLLMGAILCLIQGLQAQGFKGQALPATVNTEYDETQPRLSPDDGQLYFVRARHPENASGRGGGQDIWLSERQPDGTWGQARNIGVPLNTPLHNSVGAVLDGGRTLMLGNRYASASSEAGPGISRSKRIDGVWSNPETVFSHPLGGKSSGNFSFFYHAGTDAIICAMVGVPGAEEDLFVILPNPSGGWKAAKPLGNQVNTEGYETAPFLHPDGQTLFFTSNGRGGSGSGDIFMCKRLDDTWTNWSDPVNLGPEVNTAGFDGHFIVDAQGAFAYFVSGPSVQALGDIYSIPLKDIPALAPPPSFATDTLRLFTTMNSPIPFSLDAYGIPESRATLVAGRSVTGSGKVVVSRAVPQFSYAPAQDFVGREVLLLTYCDPPTSDDCNQIVVLAEVKGDKPVTVTPAVLTLRTSTQQNMPVTLNVPENTLRMADMPATRLYTKPQDGILKMDFNEGRDQLVYFPRKDFVGKDTTYLYRACANRNPLECRLVQIVVDVMPVEKPVVGDTPIVVKPVVEDTPVAVVVKPVVVDTPVVVKPVVVDTPVAVVVKPVVVDTPVVVKPVVADTPIVVVVKPVVVDTPVVVKPVVADTPVAVVVKPVVVDTPVVVKPKDVLIAGRVTDEKTGLPLEAEIEFMEVNGKSLGKLKTNAGTGEYQIRLPMTEGYSLKVNKTYYFPASEHVDLGKALIKGEIRRDILLAPMPMEVGQTFVLKDIYFDLDKSSLKPESRAELQRLHQLLKDYPGMEIEIRGHTDNWSSDEYNQRLSDERARAVVNYLKYMGVMGFRLRWKGLGETVPIATNDTEEGRALNRRVEFIITKM